MSKKIVDNEHTLSVESQVEDMVYKFGMVCSALITAILVFDSFIAPRLAHKKVVADRSHLRSVRTPTPEENVQDN